ncbi:MAG: zinc metallopeptidase, partial [Eggerthellaceae bacterium]|nr:zinc metallopeptidase [Eggerthellaceae bacterium]
IAGLIDLAILVYAVVVVFQLVTLPVEFNASSRTLSYMKSIGLPEAEVSGSTAVLRACAMTYVAAALASLLQLLYLLGRRD